MCIITMMVVDWQILLPFEWKSFRPSPTSAHSLTLSALFLCRLTPCNKWQWQWHPFQRMTMMLLTLLAADNQQLMTATIHYTTLPNASQWTFLPYSARYNNLQMTCKISSPPCLHHPVPSRAAATTMTPVDDRPMNQWQWTSLMADQPSQWTILQWHLAPPKNTLPF